MPAGTYVYQTVDNVRVRALAQITSNSGGVVLASGDTASATVKNLTGNSDMYVGGTVDMPYSGFGFQLGGGEAISMSVSNFNKIRVFAIASGQFVTYFGVV